MSAVLVSAVALAVTIGVLPAVRAGSVPNITSERALPAFWVAVGLHLLTALVLLLVLSLSKRRSAASISVLVATALAISLTGFALGDAAKAPLEIGAPLQVTTTLLFVCVAADVLAAALTMAAALARQSRV